MRQPLEPSISCWPRVRAAGPRSLERTGASSALRPTLQLISRIGLGAMTEPRSNIEWRQWARTDPLYGVSTVAGRERNGARPWTLPEFYAAGETAWAVWLRHWEQYGRRPDSCLEIGCGAGRITRQLVQSFDAVTGID